MIDMAIRGWGTDVDPYTNDTSKYIVILDIYNRSFPELNAPASSSATDGDIYDPNGVNVGHLIYTVAQDYVPSGTTEAFAHGYSYMRLPELLPPGYSVTNFGNAYGVICDTLEEASLFLR